VGPAPCATVARATLNTEILTMQHIIDTLTRFIATAERVSDAEEHAVWQARVAAFLQAAIGPSAADEFREIDRGDPKRWYEFRHGQTGYIEGLALKLKIGGAGPRAPTPAAARPAPTYDTKQVFVVHGHDVGAKESVARFLEKLGLAPIILHEQPNVGRTVIEKFEAFATVGFAVVLLTPDDACGTLHRARQNVILELGYFMGKLGRNRVCALHRAGVELPSDIQGILYVSLDDGGWRTRLAQELIQATYAIDLEALVKG
jgi:hypothetical protein